jgi:ankyrin repeat protein
MTVSTIDQMYMIDVISSKYKNPHIVQYDRTREVKKLLGNGLDPNFKIRSEYNSEKNPLFEAAIYCDIDIFSLLLQYGADPNTKRNDAFGTESILILLICKSISSVHTEMLELVLQHGANPNHGRDNFYNIPTKGWTPLDYLCMNNLSIEKLEILLKYGATHTINNLVMAISNNNVQMVQLLLQYGSDPYEKNIHYKDAFDYVQTDQMKLVLQNNKYLIYWLSKMRDISENGILMSIKYHPNNFNVWREYLEPTNSLLQYW